MNRLIAIIVLFALTLALGMTLVWPKYQQLLILQKINENKESELQKKQEHFQELQKISSDLKSYQSQLSKIDSALPSDPELPALLNFIQNTSSQSGLVLSQVSSFSSHLVQEQQKARATGLEEPGTDGLTVTDLSLAFSGDYPALKNFLSTVEMSARLIEVESILFSAPVEEGGQKFNLGMKVYSY